MNLVKRLLWPMLTLLILIGVSSSALRVAAPRFANDVAVPARAQALVTLGIEDTRAQERVLQVQQFEDKFTRHRAAILWHVVPGALFLLFAPLQFVRRIRGRYPAVHRWSGRVLMLLALASVIPGLWFGLFLPAGGRAETVVIALFGTLFVGAIVRAWIAIRRKQTAVHREWMTRAFAVALGISAVRLFAAPLDLLLTPTGWSMSAIFVASLWCGFGATSLAAELWLYATRPRRVGSLSTATA
jgi:hypothetical protein